MEREFSIKSLLLPQGFTEKTKEFILALGIALVGCIGSYFILGGSIKNMLQSSNETETAHFQYQKDASLHGLDDKIKQNIPNYIGGSLLAVHGSMKVDESIEFSNLDLSPGSRYLIDFGNGVRMPMDHESIVIKYNVPGIYIAQCYIWANNKWKVIAAQTLTIHP